MTTATEFVPSEEAAAVAAKRVARRALWHTRINRAAGYLEVVGLGWLMPLMRIAAGDNIRAAGQGTVASARRAALAILIFLAAWAWLAPKVETSLAPAAGPGAGLGASARILWADHLAERAKERAFFERQEKRNADILARDPNAQVKARPYTGKPTFIDQIVDQPGDGVHRLRVRDAHRGAARSAVWAVRRHSTPQSTRWCRSSSRYRHSRGCRSSPWW